MKQYKTSKRDAAFLRSIEARRLKAIQYSIGQIRNYYKAVNEKVAKELKDNAWIYNNPSALTMLSDPNDSIYLRINLAASDTEAVSKMLSKIWVYTGRLFIDSTAAGLKFNKYDYQKSGVSLLAKNTPDFSFWTNLVAGYISGKFVTKIKGINDTTQAFIRMYISASVIAGESIDKIAGAILSGGIPGMNRNRAVKIARTEVIAASNASSLETAKRTGVKGLKKRWIMRVDGRERRAHAEAGERYTREPISLDSPFYVWGEFLEYPGDPSGSAKNVINCRCAVGYVTRRFG